MTKIFFIIFIAAFLAAPSFGFVSAQAPSCEGCPVINDVAPPPAYVDVGPKMDDFPTPDKIGIWANASMASSVTVKPGSLVWLTWKSGTTYSSAKCTGSGGENSLGWNGQSQIPTGHVELGPINSAEDFTISCDQGSATVHVDVSTSATAATAGIVDTTGTAGTGTITPATLPPLVVTLTENGQTSLNLPFNFGTRTSSAGYWQETFIDVAWSANNPAAQCTAYSSYTGQAAEQGAPGPVGWGWQVLPAASGDQKVNVQGQNASYTLGITCTADGQTAHTSIPLTVGLGGGAPNSDVHIEDNYQIALTGNGQSGTITVPYGTNLLLAWSSNYPSSGIRCTATGDWSWQQFTSSGQQFTGSLYSNKVYNISCNDPTNGLFQHQDTLTVYVSSNTTPMPTPTPPPTTTTACDSTATAIVNSAGGCSSIDANKYSNIYNACCKTITKDILLQMLDTALGNGMTANDKLSLLDALNSYLSK